MLRPRYIDFLVAPYEADPQLAYLSRKGLIDFVLTEDSDLLVFGAKNILSKFNIEKQSNECELIVHDDIFKINKFCGWSEEKWISFCILLGCDYVDKPQKGLGP